MFTKFHSVLLRLFIKRNEILFSKKVPIPEGMKLISDIYQYRVDKDVECDVYIRGLKDVTLDKYNKLVVVHMTDFEQTPKVFTDVDLVNNEVKIFRTIYSCI